MILSTISFGYLVPEISISDNIKEQLSENIKSCIPEEATFLGIQLGKYKNKDNFIFVININITYESEATLGITRDSYKEIMISSIQREFDTFFKEFGIINKQLSFD